MGAKIPGRLKTRRPTCKCDICGCHFLSIQALRSHQACVHPRSNKRVAYKPKIEVIARRKLVPAKKVLRSSSVKAKIAQKKAVEKAASEKETKVSKVIKESTPVDSKRYNTRKTEFECPVCSKIYTVYFSAYRHIQKNHCINEKGEVVSPDSPDLLQPTRIELCTTCNKRVASTQPHKCGQMPDSSVADIITNDSYTCFGCKQIFPTIHVFNVHIPGLHCDEVESLFFPDMEILAAWKDNMEMQTEMKYITLSKRESIRMHNCNHYTSDDSTAWFCPSSFTVQEFTKGVQVAFYKKHYGHECKPYNLPDKFKKYVITTLIKNTEATYSVIKPKADPVELQQFHKLMNNIIKSSAHADPDELKFLVAKAWQMAVVLEKYEKTDIINAEINKAITDEQITEILEGKRKAEGEGSVPKRLRKDSKTSESGSVGTEDGKTPVKTYVNTKKLAASKEEEKKTAPEHPSPSSFNDSYKHFVDASYNITVSEPNPSRIRNKVEAKKKEIVKTKMGQFRPIILSPKKLDNKTAGPPKKPSIASPNIKPDFEYEVREQKNDCNILVIKI